MRATVGLLLCALASARVVQKKERIQNSQFSVSVSRDSSSSNSSSYENRVNMKSEMKAAIADKDVEAIKAVLRKYGALTVAHEDTDFFRAAEETGSAEVYMALVDGMYADKPKRICGAAVYVASQKKSAKLAEAVFDYAETREPCMKDALNNALGTTYGSSDTSVMEYTLRRFGSDPRIVDAVKRGLASIYFGEGLRRLTVLVDFAVAHFDTYADALNKVLASKFKYSGAYETTYLLDRMHFVVPQLAEGLNRAIVDSVKPRYANDDKNAVFDILVSRYASDVAAVARGLRGALYAATRYHRQDVLQKVVDLLMRQPELAGSALTDAKAYVDEYGLGDMAAILQPLVDAQPKAVTCN